MSIYTTLVKELEAATQEAQTTLKMSEPYDLFDVVEDYLKKFPLPSTPTPPPLIVDWPSLPNIPSTAPTHSKFHGCWHLSVDQTLNLMEFKRHLRQGDNAIDYKLATRGITFYDMRHTLFVQKLKGVPKTIEATLKVEDPMYDALQSWQKTNYLWGKFMERFHTPKDVGNLRLKFTNARPRAGQTVAQFCDYLINLRLDLKKHSVDIPDTDVKLKLQSALPKEYSLWILGHFSLPLPDLLHQLEEVERVNNRPSRLQRVLPQQRALPRPRLSFTTPPHAPNNRPFNSRALPTRTPRPHRDSRDVRPFRDPRSTSFNQRPTFTRPSPQLHQNTPRPQAGPPRPPAGPSQPPRGTTPAPNRRPPIRCFICDQPGHLQAQCPLRSTTVAPIQHVEQTLEDSSAPQQEATYLDDGMQSMTYPDDAVTSTTYTDDGMMPTISTDDATTDQLTE